MLIKRGRMTMITPVDLENKEFGKSFRGYDIDEVESFLTELTKDYAKIYRENAGLKDKNAILTDAIENYKEMEETMRSAIISAQKTSEEIIKNAHDQADNIVKEAKVRAEAEYAKMDARIDALTRECAEIEGKSSLVRAKLKTVLNTYISMLDEFPESEEAEVTAPAPKVDITSETIRIEKIDIKEPEVSEENESVEEFIDLNGDK